MGLREQRAGLRDPHSRQETWTPSVVPYTKLCSNLLLKGGRPRTQLVPTPILCPSLLSTVGITWAHHAGEDCEVCEMQEIAGRLQSHYTMKTMEEVKNKKTKTNNLVIFLGKF
jgi:hypothetical protein